MKKFKILLLSSVLTLSGLAQALDKSEIDATIFERAQELFYEHLEQPSSREPNLNEQLALSLEVAKTRGECGALAQKVLDETQNQAQEFTLHMKKSLSNIESIDAAFIQEFMTISKNYLLSTSVNSRVQKIRNLALETQQCTVQQREKMIKNSTT